MTILRLTCGGEEAPYLLEAGALSRAAEAIGPHLRGRRAFVITDDTVGPLYGEALAESLGAPILALPTGEDHKRWSSVDRAVRWLLGFGVERGEVVVAVGGGVVTDLAGFVAAVTLRGLPWIGVPTTLLCMVDASVGGKTGIDLDLGKNLIGSFWPPRAVVADPATLATLDRRQLRAGLAEVVKMGMIAPSALEHPLERHLGAVAAGGLSGVAEVVHAAVRVKAEIVTADERERGPRASLNLGHTIGHALEAATGYGPLLHGEAVSWGLLAALSLGHRRGLLAEAEARGWLDRVGCLAPLPSIAGVSWEQLRPYVARDKKREQGAVSWVLPRSGGVVMGVGVGEDEVAEVFERLRAVPPAGPFAGVL